MSHWRLHPVTRVVIIVLVVLIAGYLFVTFVYQGGRQVPAEVVNTEQPPAAAPQAGPTEHPPAAEQPAQAQPAQPTQQPAPAAPSTT
jgi:predicted PurR-regulated permease PerM